MTSYRLVIHGTEPNHRVIGPSCDFQTVCTNLATLYSEGHKSVELWVGPHRANTHQQNKVVQTATRIMLPNLGNA